MDLVAGERLPSTREMARRFKIHQNTVSAAFRELAAEGVVEFKKGSGVFVAERAEGLEKPRLEDIFSQFLDRAAAAGYSREEVEAHLRERIGSRRPGGLLIIESDEALRRIMIEEIRAASGIEADGISFENFSQMPAANGTPLAAMFDEKAKLHPVLPSGSACIFLDANSVPGSLAGRPRPSADDLIAIVSGWEKFIALAKLFLTAAKLDPEMFVARLTSDPDWRRGIEQASLIICDSLTAKQFRDDARVQVFPLISAASLEKVRELV